MGNQNKFINKLINEKSLYLLQHAHDPVDWYPWGEEAFQKAKSENKPIFLSIGYSTCHWCHVMEKESFVDENIARILNEHFVSIKVDREERPDIDLIYMNYCILLTGSGGWPLNIFMTPDKKPFYTGTYFPKVNRYGRIGFTEILLKIVELWKNDNKSIIESSENIYRIVSESTKNVSSRENLNSDIINQAYDVLKKRYDTLNGGFGKMPKFPTPHNYIFLLRYYFHTGDKFALDMVENSATKMRYGGIYDHIGFGFHRYSTDDKWLVPHFEKMLYDQALMSLMYIELYQITKNDFYKKVAEEIFEYTIRDMTAPDGGFYSAEDADSEGVEGKFYLWSSDEIKNILGVDADKFFRIYGLSGEQNFNGESTNSGHNILYLKKSLQELAPEEKISEHDFEKMRRLLFEYRKKRIPPLKDDKILTDWNGLMIASMAYGSRIFNSDKYMNAAIKAAEFILKNMINGNGMLYHRYRQRDVQINGNLDDYAFFIFGLLELYQSSFEVRYLRKAIQLQDTQIQNFWDNDYGGFFFTDNVQTKELIQRSKIYHDSAIPSGNSISLYNLIRLYHITGDEKYYRYSDQLIKACTGEVNSNPDYYPIILSAFLFLRSSSQQIVIVENKKNAKPFLDIINNKYNPYRVILLKSEEYKLSDIAPYTSDMQKIQNKPTVYICENFTCKLPVTSLQEFENSI